MLQRTRTVTAELIEAAFCGFRDNCSPNGSRP